MALLRSSQFMAVMAMTALASIILAAVGVLSADAVPQADDGFGYPLAQVSGPESPIDEPRAAAQVQGSAAAVQASNGETAVGDGASADADPGVVTALGATPPTTTSMAEDSPPAPTDDAAISGTTTLTGPATVSEPTSATGSDHGRSSPRPVRVRIPSIEVDAPVVALDLQPDGSIEVPQDWDLTGWWQDGPEPGEDGPAVILGHVDSTAGPAVFTGLHALEPGDRVIVDREDASQVTFVVRAGQLYDKDEFPTDLVYRTPTDRPALRLVTCGGRFDGGTRSYESNYVVFAEMIRT